MGGVSQVMDVAARRQAARPVRRLRRVLGVAAVSSVGPALVMAPRGGDVGRDAALLLVGVAVAAALVLAFSPWTGRLGSAASLAVAVVAAVATAGTVGRAPAAFAFAALAVADLAWAGLPVVARSTRRAPGGGFVACVLALAGAVWYSTDQSLPGAGPLLVAALFVLVSHELVPDAVGRFEHTASRARARAVESRPGRALGEVVAEAQRWSQDRRRWLRGPKSRHDRWLIAAIAVGGLLRAVWALIATRPPVPITANAALGDYYSSVNYLMAEGFSRFQTPTFAGHHTAIWPPGYAVLLSPFAWFSNHVTHLELYQVAAVLNVVIGMVTIYLAAAIASRVIAPRAAIPAAWLLALGPSQIFVTSTGKIEPLAQLMVLATIWGAVVIARTRTGPQRTRLMFGLGIVAGATILTSPFGTLLLVVPALVVRVVAGRHSQSLRTLVATVCGAAVLLVPWTVRNAVQVDWYSPTPTAIPEGLCTTKWIESFDFPSMQTNDPVLMPLLEDCFRYSPFDHIDSGFAAVAPKEWVFAEPREGFAARRNLSGALRWFATHPGTLASEAPVKIWSLVGSDNASMLFAATAQGGVDQLSPTTINVLDRMATVWYQLVATTALIGLIDFRSLRRLGFLWLYPLGLMASVVFAPYAYSRHFFIAQPFLVILAAGVIGTLASLDRADRSDRVARVAEAP